MHTKPASTARVITVGGGRRGVGNSVVASNLAAALAGAGSRVILVGLASGGRAPTSAHLAKTPVANLKFMAGAGAQAGNLGAWLRSLSADIVMVDLGASETPGGAGGCVTPAHEALEAADEWLLVTTPEVPAIHDAYSFLKGALPSFQRGGAGRGEFHAYMIGNQVTDDSQAGIFHAVSQMILDHLGLKVPVLGWIKRSAIVQRSSASSPPLMMGKGEDVEMRTFRAVADALIRVSGAGLDPVKPHVYIRPPRKRRPTKPSKVTPPGVPHRRITLPGMTPVRKITERGGRA